MRVSQQASTLTVLRTQHEVDDYISIFFAKPEGFTFKPGDCFDLLFDEDNFHEGRIFSFSSSPTEESLRITFRKGITEYKKRLEKTKKGDIFQIRSFGSQYIFYRDRPLLFYAGGIGIAVFRSIIKFFYDSKENTSLTLIFNNRTGNFPFKDELELWKKTLNLTIYYIETQKKGRLNTEKLIQIIPSIKESSYEHYIIGPPLMVDSTKDILSSLSIPQNNIHTDSFDGYVEEDA